MSTDSGRAPGLRSIPPAPPSYRLRSEPARHGSAHLYVWVRNLTYAAAGEGLSLSTIAVLTEMALRTDKDGTTRGASLREIARHLNRSPGQIQRHVKRLIELEFVEQLGRCREDNRHRLWRIAGMDRREETSRTSGENHHRGGTTSRAGGARHASTSRAGGARIPVELPGELIEPTRAFPQQEPPPARDWGRANDPSGIRASREALRARGAPGGAPGGPEPPRTVTDGSTDAGPGFAAQNGTDGAASGAA